jgi:hypothetical protein
MTRASNTAKAVVVLVALAALAGCNATSANNTAPLGLDGRPVAGLLPGRVLATPWPERVTPTGPWSATLRGSGPLVTFTFLPGRVEGGLARATFLLGSANPDRPASDQKSNLTLPDGSRWYPRGPFRVESGADLPFTSVSAQAAEVNVVVESLESALGPAGDEVTAVGPFVSAEGAEVDHLVLPRGTRVGEDCADGPPCPGSPSVPKVTVAAEEGQVLRAGSGTNLGEAAVAGTARVEALEHTWDGLVGAVEGYNLSATATLGPAAWSVEADAGAALQAWVDVWPVVDTALEASSGVDGGGHFCLGDCSLRIRWKNVGFATSQIFEAEGVGPAGRTVGFDLNKTLGHDAGLGVRRGDQRINLGGGGDVDSNLAPGGKVDRGLSYTPGTDVTIVLRGNFPDESVHLAIPEA